MSLLKLSMLFARLVDAVVTNDAMPSCQLQLVPFGCGYPSARRTTLLSYAWLQVPRGMIRALELHGYARFRFVQDFVKKIPSTCVNDNLLRWKPINTHER